MTSTSGNDLIVSAQLGNTFGAMEFKKTSLPMIIEENELVPHDVQVQPSSVIPAPSFLLTSNTLDSRSISSSTHTTTASLCSCSQSISCASIMQRALEQLDEDSASRHKQLVSAMRYAGAMDDDCLTQLHSANNLNQPECEIQTGHIQALEARCKWFERKYTAASEALRETQQDLLQQQVYAMEKTTELEDFRFDRQMLELSQSTSHGSRYTPTTAHMARVVCGKRKYHETSVDLDQCSCKRRRFF
ncbi:hypothetical protein GQ44DRAFT_731141 [Phaeosphaeriaceae sp. PMI808]|nr:hypothetical protein GQ44DRAFT_731141 [Phaeosphaeriaceae sp. PMI808]